MNKTKIILLLKSCLFLIISCTNHTLVETQNFKIALSRENLSEYMEITYIPKGIFSNDSILYFTYEEYHPDTIKLFREQVSLNKGTFNTKRKFNYLPASINIFVSRLKEPTTRDEFLFSTFDLTKERSIDDDLITMLLTDSINTAQAIYDKYKYYEDYSFIINILYGHFQMKHNPMPNIDFSTIDSLISEKIKSPKISSNDFWALLFLKIAGHNNKDIKSINLNYYFRNQFTQELSTFEYLFLREVYTQIYRYRLNNELNPFDYQTNVFMLEILNENTDFVLAPYILNTLIASKSDKTLSPELDSLLNQVFEISLDYFLDLDCNAVQEIYYFDLPYTFFANYNLFPNIVSNKIVQLLLKYSQCINSDSWLNNGYTHGYTFEFAYGLKFFAVKVLISNGLDSLALEIINDFKNSNYEDNKFTSGAINSIHVLGCEIYIKKGDLTKAKEFISILTKTRSPQLQKILTQYNDRASNLGIEPIDINSLLYSTEKVGKKIKAQYILTNKGKISITPDKKYLFLFFNEDCNPCNLTIYDIVAGVMEYDKKSDVFVTIIVSDDVNKIKAEYPGKTIATNPSELRRSFDYYSKSGTILVEDLKITYDSPHVPMNTKEFLEYIFKYTPGGN